MTLCYLGLGSNLNTPQRLIRQALQVLRKSPRIRVLQITPLEITPPWGLQSQPVFCNTIVKVNTTWSPKQLLTLCQTIENRFGRVRKKRWGPRTLDIDILLYADKTLRTSTLIVPHPFIFQRDFVLKPLEALGAFDQKTFKNPDMKGDKLPFI